MDEAKRTQILSLATDFPRLWVDPNTPDRERRRMVRLILEDVTLIREGGELVAHIRFRGSATHTLWLPIVDLRRTSSEIREEIAWLLDDRSDGEIAAILNQRGPNIRRKYGLIDRFVRYRAAGWLTLREIADLLGVGTPTIKKWRRKGFLTSHVYNGKGERHYLISWLAKSGTWTGKWPSACARLRLPSRCWTPSTESAGGPPRTLAEIGVDMSRWPSHRHMASWAKICPGNHESAGKRHSGRTGKGNRWLRGILVEASVNVTRKSDSYYAALYHRIAARRGKKRAHVAVAHSLLVAIYHMLKDGTMHHDLGADYFQKRDRDHLVRRAVSRLQHLGYRVSLEEVA